jgi:DMSO reductase family type II enzyme heme b subunit
MNSRLAISLAFVTIAVASSALGQDLERGERLYDRWCAECHGTGGAGDGSAAPYMMPRPRDFTIGVYQIRTTPNGELPSDADLAEIIERGMPGTAMPGWASKFNAGEIGDLVAYIKSLSRFFEQFGAPEPLDFGRSPRLTEEGLARGRQLYEEIECFKCHGDAGRGDGQSAPTLQDDLDFPVRAADLTESWNFNGGGTVEDIYRRLRTGLDGTPMPSFSDLLDSGFMSEEELWYLAQYVRSLGPDQPPRVREVIAARRIEGDLPSAPDDSIWNVADAFFIPMVGQIIVESRWFAPSVDGLWVKALHNDEELALRVAWSDPSESPDPAWLEWGEWVNSTNYPASDSASNATLPDRLTVQFPSSIPTGRDRPYFLMGDSRRPVYLWGWSSDGSAPAEAQATGIGTERSIGAGPATTAVWDRGEWRLQFRRSLAAADSSVQLGFRGGTAIPIAFFAWDGSNGEQGTQMSISSWYSIYLEQPTPSTVYLSPLFAMLATAALGLVVIWRAQRREGEF